MPKLITFFQKLKPFTKFALLWSTATIIVIIVSIFQGKLPAALNNGLGLAGLAIDKLLVLSLTVISIRRELSDEKDIKAQQESLKEWLKEEIENNIQKLRTLQVPDCSEIFISAQYPEFTTKAFTHFTNNTNAVPDKSKQQDIRKFYRNIKELSLEAQRYTKMKEEHRKEKQRLINLYNSGLYAQSPTSRYIALETIDCDDKKMNKQCSDITKNILEIVKDTLELGNPLRETELPES